MTCTTAMIIVVTCGVVFAAVGAYASILQIKWINQQLDELAQRAGRARSASKEGQSNG